MNDPDFNLLAALDPLPVSTEVITVSQAWKQCEQCRTEYLSYLLNYSVMRKIIFLI